MVHGSLDTENDVVIIACGEMVRPSIKAAELLARKGITAAAVDMYCVKPLDREVVIKAARHAKLILTVEEHAPYGGLGTEELSGTGVVFMAGMKLGLWDKEIFDTIKRRHVLPQMAEDVRRQKYEGYQKAVDRIRN